MKWTTLATVLGCAALVACSSADKPETSAEEVAEEARVATATLTAAKGKKLEGEVHFTQSGKGIMAHVQVKGLTPNSQHGIHIHENGKCEGPAFTSAGGHWNPTDEPHAGPQTAERHLGDMGNLETDEAGNAQMSLLISRARLEGDRSLLGKAVIIHGKPDDLKSQPSGNSGARIACGVIEGSATDE